MAIRSCLQDTVAKTEPGLQAPRRDLGRRFADHATEEAAAGEFGANKAN